MIGAIKGLLDALDDISHHECAGLGSPPSCACRTCIARRALEAWAKREPLRDAPGMHNAVMNEVLGIGGTGNLDLAEQAAVDLLDVIDAEMFGARGDAPGKERP